MWIHGFQSFPPASSKSTRVVRSADKRFASTQPAEPAPTMMKSNSPVSCMPALRESRSDILSHRRCSLYDVLQLHGARHACSSIGDYWSGRSHDNSHDSVRFPGRISWEGSRRRVVSRRGRSGLRPWLSLGRQTSQPIWRMGSGALRKERSYMSETLAPQVLVAFRFK